MATTYKLDSGADQVEEVNDKPIVVKETQAVTTTITIGELEQRKADYQAAIDSIDAQIAEIKTATGLK